MIRDAGTLDALKSYDMNLFRDRLYKKAKSIPPTVDIAVFGRQINGCGLKEYDSAIQMAVPFPITGRRNAWL